LPAGGRILIFVRASVDLRLADRNWNTSQTNADVRKDFQLVRGVFVRGALLCAPSPPPSGDAIRKLAEVTNARTTRDKFEQHTRDPFCQGCHERIDGIGFGLEDFDAIGTLRTTENGFPIDASGRLLDAGDVDGPFVGGAELSRKLAQSPKVAACFVRQVFRSPGTVCQ
jgi:hypothetical protein